MVKTVVMIATYNEKENILRLISQILKLKEQFDVMIVDDNSPDGTSQLIKEHYGKEKRVVLFTRYKDKGYGKSVLAGFQLCLQKRYQRILTLDADFSHDPKDLSAVYKALNNADMAIGSRYFKGIRILNWDPSRLMISIYGNVYIKTVLGMPYKDMTSGYRGYRSGLLRAILKKPVKAKGYAFLVEILFRAFSKKAKIKEVRICYTDRKEGESKMTKGILVESVFSPLRMKILSWFGYYH